MQASGLELDSALPLAHFGTVFMSNYLEHLESSDAVIQQLSVVRRLLAPGGRAIVLQPNIRLVGPRYWDFIDHRVALTERSLLEAAELAGLRTHTLVTRFIPYSTKGRLPAAPWLVRAYLSHAACVVASRQADALRRCAGLTEQRRPRLRRSRS